MLQHIFFLFTYSTLNYQSIILNEYNEKYFNEATVIIPFGINAQIALNNYPQYNHKFLINPKTVYDELDDKINFYEMIKKYKFLDNSEIKLISSYDDKYIKDKNVNIYGKFIIKNRNGAGSSDESRCL